MFSVLLCVAPPAEQLQLYAPYPRNATLKASLNALDYSPANYEAVQFTYVPTYTALAAVPDVGPASGNTTIDVRGTNITSSREYTELTCRVGVTSVPASLVDPGTLRCSAPSLLAGESPRMRDSIPK